MQTDDYTIVDINGGRIGIVQGEPKRGKVIKLAARYWEVKKVSQRSKIAYVCQTDRNGISLFGGVGVEVPPLIIEKMKDVYNSSDEYPYLDSNAKEQFLVGQRFFSLYKLGCSSFVEYDGKSTLFTWAGVRINHTIELILKLYLEDIKLDECNAIYIVGVKPSDIAYVIKKEKPNATELASLLDFELKICHKYDFLLTEELINIFKINWNRYVGNSRYFNCNIWNPIYYMELDIIFKVSDIDYDNQKPQCIERCLEVYKYFEFSPILWKALQNERDRNDIKRLLIDKYIINNRWKNNSFMIELIPLLINSCYLLAI
jgi:hypothetical protein